MDFQRLLLVTIFSLSSLMLWESWQAYLHPVPALVTTAGNEKTQFSKKITENLSPVAKVEIAPAGKKITVKTDSLFVNINTAGGNIEYVELLQHKNANDKSKPIVLMQQGDGRTYIAQTGLLGSNLPNHNATFSSVAENYELAPGKDELDVGLEYAVDGKRIIKTYTFHRGSHLVDVNYRIENFGKETQEASAYFQLVRDGNPPEGDSKLVPTYTGPAIYTDADKFQKIDFESIEKDKVAPKQANNGWVAMLQHYFVSAWLPSGNLDREFYTKKLDENLYSAGVLIQLPKIEPGQKGDLTIPLYLGPAHADLDQIAPGFGLTVDYGWLTIIASPLFFVLTFIQGWVHNWGIAIIVLTILIKLAFFPLSAASYRSMAKMRVVAPKLEKIKQQYGDDRERLNRAMMDLYKTEKINPLGGCLPILIQIPVFIALYWAILSSVELRHAPFFGWIDDLSAIDPYYVLPVIMGISMWVQSKLNPVPPDPLQAKLMQTMPIIFSVVFFFFPAGLVLYSIVNNLLSIGQQWYITSNLEIEQKVSPS